MAETKTINGDESTAARSTVSIILPVHNEGSTLEFNVRQLERRLERELDDFEIIISEDGSTDGTVEAGKRLRSPAVRFFSYPARLGKGAAIKSASHYARGDIIIFMDADLASDPGHVRELVGYLEGSAAIVIGSRYLPQSKTRRSFIRDVASRGFNLLVRILLGSKLADHQCGFKAFRKGLVLPILDEIEERGWFWDTELLVRAQRKGLVVVEIPINWSEKDGSKFRLIRDSWKMACSLARFKLKNG